MYKIADYWANVQRSLLPHLEACLPEALTANLQRLVYVLDLLRIEEHIPSAARQWRGRKRADRRALARAFVAKACLNLPTTEALWDRLQADPTLRRLCGWEQRRRVPSRATFSRAFAEFANTHLVDRVHAALVEKHAGDTVIWHVSRDSTPIEARERAAPPPPKKPKGPRGRPRKGAAPPAPPEEKRLARQYWASSAQTDELLAELPKQCTVGVKKEAPGRLASWKGYKLHVDVGDTGLPLLAVTTAASLHDSQVAIPMARKTAQRVTVLYELMDSAYDAEYIHQTVMDLKHVGIIDHNPGRGEKIPMEPDRARRYAHRSEIERFNADLKDNHGGRTVRVRGQPKVHTHLMFGVLVIFAKVVLGWPG